MTVERRDEPIDERQRRTAQLHRLAEFGPLDQLEAGHVVVSSRPALAGRLATYPRWMISLEQAARSARGHAPANNLQQSWRFDWEPPKAVLRDFRTIDWILGQLRSSAQAAPVAGRPVLAF